MKRSTFDEDDDIKEYDTSKRQKLDDIVEEEMLEDIENESLDEKLLNICILGFAYNKVDASYIESNASNFNFHTYHLMLSYRHGHYDVLVSLLEVLQDHLYEEFLLRAIEDNKVELVKSFVENDELNYRIDNYNENPLIVSARYGRREITEYLLGKDKFSKFTKDVVKIFSFLCRDGIIDLVEKVLPLIIESPNKSVLLASGLADAIEHKHENIIDLILKQKFTISYHYARAFVQACISYSNPGLLKKIISKGDFKHQYYYDCLKVAVQYSHYDIVDYILEQNDGLLKYVDLTDLYEYWDGSERKYFTAIPDDKFKCLIGLARNRKINTYEKFVKLYDLLEKTQDMIKIIFLNVFVGGNIEIFKKVNYIFDKQCVLNACEFKNIDLICYIIEEKIVSSHLLPLLADYNIIESVYVRLSTEAKKYLHHGLLMSNVLEHDIRESTKRFIVEHIYTREFMLVPSMCITIEQLIKTGCFNTVGWIFNGYVLDGIQNPEKIIVYDNLGNHLFALNIRMDIRMCANLMDGRVNVRSEYVRKLENYRVFLIRREVLKLYNKKLPVEIVDKIISYIPYMPGRERNS